MEITQIKIKVKTLNKGLFNQLETTTEKFTDSQVVGWVNTGMDTQLVIISGDHLRKIKWVDLWQTLSNKADAPAGDMEAMRKYVRDYVHHYPQIFI